MSARVRRIDLIAGARPNFMKVAPLIRALRAAEARGGPLRFRLVHTGQHYDHAMSAAFFESLGIPAPDVNLEVGSGTQAEQTAAIMVRYERLLLDDRADACVVVGDVTSTMACTIVARKLGVPVAHVEAGIRSGDWTMPEEVNRVVTDALTDWFFTTSRSAGAELRRTGVAEERIHFVGNTMIDTLLHERARLRPAPCWDALGLAAGGYLVLTLHRPANVDDDRRLRAMLQAVADGAAPLPVVYPVHPRVAARVRAMGPAFAGLHPVEPLAYHEFNHLVAHARAVVTDSGGVTEEATVLGVPCLTLRDSTERPETVSVGTNELIGTDPAALAEPLARVKRGEWKRGAIPELWDGRAAERIVAALERVLA